MSPLAVERRSFLPLIQFTKKTRRYSRAKGKSIKLRPIHYASHVDSAIYSYYAHTLSGPYEKWLKQNNLSDCVIAYRSLGRSNIDFAAEIFDAIRHRGPCVGLCFDIEGFFPSLNHQYLKKCTAAVLETTALPRDWYAVFRSVTKYASIDRNDVQRVAGKKLTSAAAGRAVTPEQLRVALRSAGCVQVNAKPHGIPQGTPISAILANVYLAEFDVAMSTEATSKGAIYRRYSDDILIICDLGQQSHFEALVAGEIAKVHLTLNANKSERTVFSASGNSLVADKPLQYLGFTFDGRNARIRPSSLSRFYRRMAVAVRATAMNASRSIQAGKTERFFRRGLYERFTSLGRKNFLTRYAKRAGETIGENAIAQQTRRAASVLKRRIRKFEVRLRLR